LVGDLIGDGAETGSNFSLVSPAWLFSSVLSEGEMAID